MTNKRVTLRCVKSKGRDGVLKTGELYQGYLSSEGDRWLVPDVPGGVFYLGRFVEEPSIPLPAGVGGMKYDGGKARMALLFDGCPNALEAVGQVLTFGAQKYAAHSWQTVPEGEERYKSALLRHLLAVGKGEEIDPESNLHHLAHAACNALFILELELRKQNA